MAAATEPTESNRTIAGVAAALVCFSLVWFLAMHWTSTASDGDSFDSQLWFASWIVFPALGYVVSSNWPSGNLPWLWTGCLSVPMMITVALLGTVFHDPGDGPSFWFLAVYFLLIQSAVIAAFALFAAARSAVSHRSG